MPLHKIKEIKKGIKPFKIPFRSILLREIPKNNKNKKRIPQKATIGKTQEKGYVINFIKGKFTYTKSSSECKSVKSEFEK